MDFIVQEAVKNSQNMNFENMVGRANIKVLGVGGGGSNMVSWLYKKGVKGAAASFDGVDDYSGYTNQERYKYLEYYKIKFTAEWYFPLTKDKKLVLMPRIGFGFMGAYNKGKGVTPFERFNLGGSGLTGVNQIGGQEIIALRGYEDGSGGLNSQGGDPFIAKYTLELRYPISLNPSATFYGLIFAEAGNTFPDAARFNPFNVKRAAGIGINAQRH